MSPRGLNYLDEESEDDFKSFEKIYRRPHEYIGPDKKEEQQIRVRKNALERNAIKRDNSSK